MKMISNRPNGNVPIQRKKSGTRPGPGNLTVDMLKAANEQFTELTRLIANTPKLQTQRETQLTLGHGGGNGGGGRESGAYKDKHG